MRGQISTSSGRRRMRGRVRARAVRIALAALAATACGAGEAPLPPELQDPGQVQTPAGALAFYREVVLRVPELMRETLALVGIMTDELAALPLPIGGSSDYTALDSRQDFGTGGSRGIYTDLHVLRAQAREARGFVETYLSDTGTAVSKAALTGHLYALEGYAGLLLAELYCSGIPLSTVDFQGDYTLTAGFSTDQVTEHALALFDSALARIADSAALQAFAAVGRGRALLNLARYAEAAAAVAAVPDGYAYQPAAFNPVGGGLGEFAAMYPSWPGRPSAADHEGENGLDYRSSGDPRTTDTLLGPDKRGYDMYFPLKYAPPEMPPAPTLASGIEARLIEAEAALRANPDDGQWLATLNHLRQTAWTTIVPATSGPLPDLADPRDTLPDPVAAKKAREDLLFRERAFWLYLTAHRQGDLRRLIRQYGRPPESVYPHGFYQGGTGQYGHEVVAPVPDEERRLNPKYTGCINHNA